MKIRCIQTCADLNDKQLCFEGRDYNYNGVLSNNKAIWIVRENLQFYGVFERQNFVNMAEHRENQINSILDGPEI